MFDELVTKVNAVGAIDVSKFVTNTKIVDIENKIPDRDKYITTPKFNKLTKKKKKKINEKLKQANLASKNAVLEFIKNQIPDLIKR